MNNHARDGKSCLGVLTHALGDRMTDLSCQAIRWTSSRGQLGSIRLDAPTCTVTGRGSKIIFSFLVSFLYLL
jgi:hypothetical protein